MAQIGIPTFASRGTVYTHTHTNACTPLHVPYEHHTTLSGELALISASKRVDVPHTEPTYMQHKLTNCSLLTQSQCAG